MWAIIDATKQTGDIEVDIDWQGDPPPVGKILGARLIDLDDPNRPTAMNLDAFDTHFLLPCSNGAADLATSCNPNACGAFGQLRGPDPAPDFEVCSVFPWGLCVAGKCETEYKVWKAALPPQP